MFRKLRPVSQPEPQAPRPGVVNPDRPPDEQTSSDAAQVPAPVLGSYAPSLRVGLGRIRETEVRAYLALDRVLPSRPIEGRPVTQDALRSLGHETLNAQAVQDAYTALERAPITLWGVDAQDLVQGGIAGGGIRVRPYAPVTTPGQATGREPLTRADQAVPLADALEQRVQTSKREIFKRLGIAAGFVIVRLVADSIQGVADAARNVLSIKLPVVRKRISVGGVVAWPFDKLAALLYRLADYLEAKALGVAPPPTPVPEPGPYVWGEFPEDFDDNEPDDGPAFDPPNPADAFARRAFTETGIETLMAALAVLRAVQADAQADRTLRRALAFYDRTRTLAAIGRDLTQAAQGWAPEGTWTHNPPTEPDSDGALGPDETRPRPTGFVPSC